MGYGESGTGQSVEWINCPHCSSTLYASELSSRGGLQFILYGQQNLRRNFFCIECYDFIPFAMIFPKENEYRRSSKSKSKREKWSSGTNHKEWIRDNTHEKERYRIWEIFDGDKIKYAGKVKKIEPRSKEWKIYLRAIGIEPEKLGKNLNLVDGDASKLISFLQENEDIIHKMNEIQNAFLKAKESVDECLRELELNKSAELTKNAHYSLMSEPPIEHKQLFSETIQGWDTVFGKARQVADSKPLNVNKREMALLRFVRNKGWYEGKDWMELNRSWRGEMKEVSQARISQIISSLIEKEYLETVQTKGSGSSRVVKIPNNLHSDFPTDLASNNQLINANSHWTKDDDELLAVLKDRNLTIAEIAYELSRSEASIRSRLVVIYNRA